MREYMQVKHIQRGQAFMEWKIKDMRRHGWNRHILWSWKFQYLRFLTFCLNLHIDTCINIYFSVYKIIYVTYNLCYITSEEHLGRLFLLLFPSQKMFLRGQAGSKKPAQSRTGNISLGCRRNCTEKTIFPFPLVPKSCTPSIPSIR